MVGRGRGDSRPAGGAGPGSYHPGWRDRRECSIEQGREEDAACGDREAGCPAGRGRRTESTISPVGDGPACLRATGDRGRACRAGLPYRGRSLGAHATEVCQGRHHRRRTASRPRAQRVDAPTIYLLHHGRERNQSRTRALGRASTDAPSILRPTTLKYHDEIGIERPSVMDPRGLGACISGPATPSAEPHCDAATV
ncbi:hypothetical protein PHLGIDRAFT_394945 [Phlebiopsis gigantea 11061_1 CR5-6]|uniref:Uncharacterized protein n=1 Tax=Phlebiopsis gigantea (strain 11061_1 CR5-6) TaxID=745531 RepID=A0A0C3NS73_PHLG1|nr:hypothetical protein PHLGIDRAFT_394945 [Phlebiopsis gigantea 11061_1 CR5-6]